MKLKESARRPELVRAGTVLHLESAEPTPVMFDAARDLLPDDFERLSKRTGYGTETMNVAVAALAFPERVKELRDAVERIKQQLLTEVGQTTSTANQWPNALAVGILQKQFPPGLVRAWGEKAWKDTKKSIDRNPLDYSELKKQLPGLIGLLLILPEKREEIQKIFDRFTDMVEQELSAASNNTISLAASIADGCWRGLLVLAYPDLRKKIKIRDTVWYTAKEYIQHDSHLGSQSPTKTYVGDFQDKVLGGLLFGHPDARIENGKIVLTPVARSPLTPNVPLPARSELGL